MAREHSERLDRLAGGVLPWNIPTATTRRRIFWVVGHRERKRMYINMTLYNYIVRGQHVVQT